MAAAKPNAAASSLQVEAAIVRDRSPSGAVGSPSRTVPSYRGAPGSCVMCTKMGRASAAAGMRLENVARSHSAGACHSREAGACPWAGPATAALPRAAAEARPTSHARGTGANWPGSLTRRRYHAGKGCGALRYTARSPAAGTTSESHGHRGSGRSTQQTRMGRVRATRSSSASSAVRRSPPNGQ